MSDSTYFVLSLVFSLTFQTIPTNDIRWITTARSKDVCLGSTEEMIWEFDHGRKDIIQLEWFFNNSLICRSSNQNNFEVDARYQDRVERFGKAGIQLKNISGEDEGIYTLYPLVDWSIGHTMQSISIRVIEPPTDECKCNISFNRHALTFTSNLMATGCGRPQASVVWKSSRSKNVLGKGKSYVINSSFSDEEGICCVYEPAMACYTGSSEKLCESFSIPHAYFETASEGPNNGILRENTIYINLFICVVLNLVLTLSLVVWTILLRNWRRSKCCKNRSYIC